MAVIIQQALSVLRGRNGAAVEEDDQHLLAMIFLGFQLFSETIF